MRMCEDLRHHFVVQGRGIGRRVRTYLGGILSRPGRKDLERIQTCVKNANRQAMQQMIGDSP